MVPVAPNKVKGDKLIILQLILPYYLRTYEGTWYVPSFEGISYRRKGVPNLVEIQNTFIYILFYSCMKTIYIL